MARIPRGLRSPSSPKAEDMIPHEDRVKLAEALAKALAKRGTEAEERAAEAMVNEDKEEGEENEISEEDLIHDQLLYQGDPLAAEVDDEYDYGED